MRPIIITSMGNTLSDWHIRYSQQARWTSSIRAYLYKQAALPPSSRVLDLACGTGVLLAELAGLYAQVFGLDLDSERVLMAMRSNPKVSLIQADAHHLPYAPQSFDLVVCHFVLLWVTDPLQVLLEMARLTRPGGVVLALAEPDYGGRIDFPTALEQLGHWQTQALYQQGANPFLGRRLAGLFRQSGLQDIETGVLGGQWGQAEAPEDVENEWEVLTRDLSATAEFLANQEAFRQEFFSAWQRGTRVLFVPTFYAFGRKR